MRFIPWRLQQDSDDKITGLLCAFLASGAVPALAAQSDTPATLQAYPDPDCAKPEAKLIKPEGFDVSAVNSYNLRVKRYNDQLRAYNSCLHAYIDKANGDVKQTQETANAEMARIRDTANARMKEIEQKVRDAIATANAQAGETITNSGRGAAPQ